MRHAILVGLGALALAGCASTLADVPALGPRPAERQPILPPDPASEPDTAADPALALRLDGIVADARAADAKFARTKGALAGSLERARGATEGGEAWIAGQQALSALDAAQTPVRDAAASIDALRADPAHAGSGDRAAIDRAAAQVTRLADDEAAAIAATAPPR